MKYSKATWKLFEQLWQGLLASVESPENRIERQLDRHVDPMTEAVVYGHRIPADPIPTPAWITATSTAGDAVFGWLMNCLSRVNWRRVATMVIGGLLLYLLQQLAERLLAG